MRGHAGGEPAIVREWRGSRALGGKSAGLVYSTEFSWITLNPASHQGSVVIGITIWTPRYSCPLPHRVEKDTEPATLISGRIEILIVLRGELVVCEECNRVTWTFPIKLDTRRKSMDRHIGIIPKLHRQDVPCEMPGGRRDQCSSAPRGPRRSESFQHFLVPTTSGVSAAHYFNMKCQRCCCYQRLDKRVTTWWLFVPDVTDQHKP